MNYHDEVSDDEEENTKEGGFQESMSIEATNKVNCHNVLHSYCVSYCCIFY